MRKELGILLGSGIAASTLIAVSMLPTDRAEASGLVSFDACSDVLAHLQSEAEKRVAEPWGIVSPPQARTFSVDSTDVAVEDSAASDLSGAAEPTHSTTNVQEIGVDEPDIIKTDGRLLLTTAGSSLHVIDVTGDRPEEVGRLDIGSEYQPAELFFAGDRAVIFSQGFTDPGDVEDMPSQAPSFPTSTVRLVDLSDPARPSIKASLEFDGAYRDARLVDGTVHVVTTSVPRIGYSMAGLDEFSGDGLTEEHREMMAGSTVEDWLPSYTLRAGDTSASGLLVECGQVHKPTGFAGFSTVSVLTFDLDGLLTHDAVGVLSDGDTVYASADQLYVATAHLGDLGTTSSGDVIDIAPVPSIQSTGIHAFDIRGDGPARYLASGEVDGEIIGSYAMSEHDGVLRIATTTDAHDAQNSESQLVTLAERGRELIPIGQVGGLGKGERIYAVRYFGDTAYVVTFRETDPLYVVDLSDPSSPSVEGELKITGYSSYLHAVGPGRLVGIGQEATETGAVLGTQVSLFDVSDPADPRKLDGHVADGAWSAAESNPHAFLYWPQTKQLVVPMMRGGQADEPGALVLTVDDGAVSVQGTITDGSGPGRSEERWMSVERSLVIGGSLYTLWEGGLQVNDLESLEFSSWLPL